MHLYLMLKPKDCKRFKGCRDLNTRGRRFQVEEVIFGRARRRDKEQERSERGEGGSATEAQESLFISRM